MPADAVAAGPPAPAAVAPSGRPALSRHVRMRFDRVRERHVLLGPESVIVLNPTGADILGLCDGQRRVSDVAAVLRTLGLGLRIGARATTRLEPRVYDDVSAPAALAAR